MGNRLENVSFERACDLFYVMRRPLGTLQYPAPEEMAEVMRGAEQRITVHLHVLGSRKKKEDCLLGLNRWGWFQLYIAIRGGELFVREGYGRSSGARELHSHMIELMLADRELRRRTLTAIVVTRNGEPLAYYFYEHYAYLDRDVGSNWGRDLRGRVRRARMPYSEITGFGDGPAEVRLRTARRNILVYREMREDIRDRRIFKRQKWARNVVA